MMFTGLFTAALAIGSAVAAPAPTQSAEGTVSSASSSTSCESCQTMLVDVEQLKVTVEKEIKSITEIVKTTDAESAAPMVQKSLSSLTVEIQTVVNEVGPLALGLIDTTLSEADLSIVLEVVNDVKAIVADVKGEVESLVEVLGGDVVATLQAELEGLLCILTSLVSPILALVYGLVGSLAQCDISGVLEEVLSAVGDLKTTVTGLLDPVTGLLQGLLGGVLGGLLG